MQPTQSPTFAPFGWALTLRCITAALTLAVATGFPTPAAADYLGTETVRIFVDPEDLPVITDGYQNGDIVGFILEATPRDTGSDFGHGSWMTLYIPQGVEVVGTERVVPFAAGNGYSSLPMEPMDETYDECGARGCVDFSGFDNGLVQLRSGRVSSVQQDVGIFYSTDPRTAIHPLGYGVVNPTGVNANTAYNQWDFDQVIAFGESNALSHNSGKGVTPIISVNLGLSWAGTGSPVAGPDTYYTNDYNPTCDGAGTEPVAADLQCQGPWARVAYNGSQIAHTRTLAPCLDLTEPDGSCDNRAPISNPAVATGAGVQLSAASPLPPQTNAVRITHGARRIGDLEFARVRLKIKDAAAFTSTFDGCAPGDPAPCNTFCVDAIPGDTSNTAAKDNNWRYYEAEHLCIQASASGVLHKQATHVNGKESNGQILQNGDVVSYAITFTNTSGNTLYDISLSDAPVVGSALERGLLEPGSALCAYSSFSGTPTPSYIAGTATSSSGNGPAKWTTVPELGHGEALTVFMCGAVNGNVGDFSQNEAKVDFALQAGGPTTTLHSVASGALASSISGTVFFDADRSGTETSGDQGRGFVVVQLWIDADGDGMLSPGDTILDELQTAADGSYFFAGVPGGDYLVVETDPPGSESSGDADSGPAACNSGNGCNVVAVSIANGEHSPRNNFYDTGDALAAVIHKLAAFAEGGGTVVEWSTASEAGSVGFRLERQNADGWQPVPGGRFPASLAAQGAHYRVFDSAPSESSVVYRVIETELNGQRIHGPYRVAVQPPREQAPESTSSVFGTRTSASALSRLETSEPIETAAEAGPSTSPAPVRLDVREEGLVRLRASDLAQLWNLDPVRVRSWISTGRMALETGGVAVAWASYQGGEELMFFGVGIDSLYTNDNVYWLHPGSAGKLMPAATLAMVGGAAGDTFPSTILFEEDRIPALTLTTETEVDHWYWQGVRAGDPEEGSQDFEVELPDSAPGASRLLVHLVGASDGDDKLDHRAEIFVNGLSLGTTEWSGIERHTAGFEVHSNPWREASTITVEGRGSDDSLFFVDSFEVTYPRYLIARNGVLNIEGVSGSVRVSGLDEGSWVLDVTQPESPVRLPTAQFGGQQSEITFSARAGRRYWAAAPAAARPPHSLVLDSPSDLLEASTADYIVIAGPGLASGAQAIAAHRAASGLDVLVVDVQDIYDEFNHGVVSPWAIHSFLRSASTGWRSAPSYALLVGSGTYDPRDILGHGDNRIAPILLGTENGLTSADTLLADLDPNRDGLEIALGRLPVLSNEEVFDYVAKVVEFEHPGGAWRERAILLSDDGDASGDYSAFTDEAQALLPPSMQVLRSDLDGRLATEVRAELIANWNAGALLTSYIGHGGVDRYAAESLLTAADTDLLESAAGFPIALSWSCVVARHELAAFDALGEALVNDPDGGAIAVWAPSGLVASGSSYQLNTQFFTELFSHDHERLGDVIRATVSRHLKGGGRMETTSMFTLLGDPALAIKP